MFTAIVMAIAAVAGVVVSAVSAANQASYNRKQYQLQQEQLLNEYQSTLLDLRSNLVSTEQTLSQYEMDKETLENVTLPQTQADIGSYEEALNRWEGNYNLQMNQLQAEGENQYDTLMGNWANQEVINAESGRTGKTADILEQQQKNKVINYVGSDLKLNSNGGLYGQTRNELNLDLLAEKSSYQGQLDILNQAYGSYTDSLAKYNTNINKMNDSLAKYKDQIAEYEKLIQDQQKVVNG